MIDNKKIPSKRSRNIIIYYNKKYKEGYEDMKEHEFV